MARELVASTLVAKVKFFNMSLHHGINNNAIKEEPLPDVPAYKSYTYLKLTTEILEPKEQKGYTLIMERDGDESHFWQLKTGLNGPAELRVRHTPSQIP
jgi:hypothetical protein